MKTFLVAALGSLVAVSANQCSHTTCMMIAQPTPYGVHEVMAIIHSNSESKCAKYETVSTNSGLANHKFHADGKVHCAAVKRWEQDARQVANGKWVYDGKCECHKKGSHPNGDGGIQEYTSLVATDKFDFNDKGSTNKLINTKAVYKQDDFKVTLSGFTHTRPYARGYLRNINGEAKATVSNLEPGKAYDFKIFQFDSSGLSYKRPLNGAAKGANGFSVNGVAQADTITLKSSNEPTATGKATANADGTITFGFTRKQHHVDLSGIEITGARVADPTSFKQGNKNRLLSKTTEYTLEGGYVAKLEGWTHTRTYAGGFLRNKAGDGTATVSGLRPGAQYKYHVHQFDSSGMSYGRKARGNAKGANGFSVNGVAQADTITLKKSTAPTASGLATANADGTIEFAFTRKQHHVDLSGLSVHLAVDAVAPFEEAPGAANCASGQIIDTVDECRLAAEHVGRPFRKAVRDATSRPAGCFWDQNGSAYFNQELGASATWGGVGGLCRAVPSVLPLCQMVDCAPGYILENTDRRGCGGTCAEESTFFMAPGAENCPTGKVVNTEAECRKAATSIGRKFAKAVAAKTGRPAGCFWDKNGAVYYNKELGASATWGGVGGLCRPVAMAVPACEADKYMAAYPDLAAAFGGRADGGLAAAANHWHRHGKKEGRTCPTDCDWKLYLARYADLTRAFGTDVIKGRTHYENHGLREGRSCVPAPTYCDWQTYLDRYADLAAAFGANNIAKAETHFVTHGAKEGRDCKA